MANLPETSEFVENIFQLEITTPNQAGPASYDDAGNPTGGFLNVQAEQLAKRTQWLKEQVESASGGDSKTVIKAGYFPSSYIIPEEAVGNIVDFDDYYGSNVFIKGSVGSEGDMIYITSSNYGARVFYLLVDEEEEFPGLSNGTPLPTPSGTTCQLRDSNSIAVLYKSATGWIMTGDLMEIGAEVSGDLPSGYPVSSASGASYFYITGFTPSELNILAPVNDNTEIYLDASLGSGAYEVPTGAEYFFLNGSSKADYGLSAIVCPYGEIVVANGLGSAPRELGSVFTVKHLGNNIWLVFGDLAEGEVGSPYLVDAQLTAAAFTDDGSASVGYSQGTAGALSGKGADLVISASVYDSGGAVDRIRLVMDDGTALSSYSVKIGDNDPNWLDFTGTEGSYNVYETFFTGSPPTVVAGQTYRLLADENYTGN